MYILSTFMFQYAIQHSPVWKEGPFITPLEQHPVFPENNENKIPTILRVFQV